MGPRPRAQASRLVSFSTTHPPTANLWVMRKTWNYSGSATQLYFQVSEVKWKSRSMSNSVWPHGRGRGILQARILEWIAVPFSRGSSQPRDRTQVSRIAGVFFTSWATRKTFRVKVEQLKQMISSYISFKPERHETENSNKHTGFYLSTLEFLCMS